MRFTHTRLTAGLAMATIAVGLTACSGSPAGVDDTKPAPEHVATSSTPSSAEHNGAAATCAAVSVLSTFTSNASIEHDQGSLSDSQYAAVLHFVPSALNAIDASPQDGLQDHISALTESIAKSPPVVPGAIFEPTRSDFESAMSSMAKACKANGYELITFSSTAGG